MNLKYFKQFCIREMSVENLLFVLEATDYRSIEAPEYRRFMARKIFQKYIRPDAPFGIAVQSRTRQEIDSQYTREAPSMDLFDLLTAEVLVSMKLDIMPRFLESAEYQELLELKFEERKVVDMKEFDLYRFLGAGGFGMVLLAKKRDTQRFYAIKVIDKRILISQNQTHSIYREKEVQAAPQTRTRAAPHAGKQHPFVPARRPSLRCWRASSTRSSSRCDTASRRRTTSASCSTSSRAATCTAT